MTNNVVSLGERRAQQAVPKPAEVSETPPLPALAGYVLPGLINYICALDHPPYITVRADMPGVQVPRQLVNADGTIVFNISADAISQWHCDVDTLSFIARFGGVQQTTIVPTSAIVAIFAKDGAFGFSFGIQQ